MTKINRIVKYEIEGQVFDNLDAAEARLKELLSGTEEVYQEFVNGTLSHHINNGQPFNVNDSSSWIVYDPNYRVIHYTIGTLENTLKDALRSPDFILDLGVKNYGYIQNIEFRFV